MNKYQQIAEQLADDIKLGRLKPGEKLPGVRKLAEHFQVSASTIVSALHRLESQLVVFLIDS